jgi:hypothetical protein
MRVRRYVKVSVVLALLVLLGFAALISGSLYTYSVLTDEALIAELRFTELGPQHFEATLITDEGCRQRDFELFGDQWRLDAEFLKWHNWALLLGFEARYRLTRIEGRYSRIEDQNTQRNFAWALDDEPALDLVGLVADSLRFDFLVDSTYGSSTFRPIDTRSVHRVYRTQTGLIARSTPLPEERPGGESLTVEIRNACGRGPGLWRRFALWVDRGLGRLLS